MTASGHEVQLDSADPKAMRDHVPSTALEVTDRVLFAGETPTMSRVAPFRWIAVNAARHAPEIIWR